MNNTSGDELLLQKIKDPKFYLENFCKIKSKQGGLIPFILNEAQKDLFNTLRTNERVEILKARQVGFSTAVTGFLYHKTITNPGTTSAIVGYNSSMTSELLDKVKTFYRTTPPEIRPTISYNSKYEIAFPKIESKILVLPSSENVGRGYTFQNILCLSGDTEILSENGKIIKMRDVQVGDKVVNGEGRLTSVVKKWKKKNVEELVQIFLPRNINVKATKEHKMLAYDTDTGGAKWIETGKLSINNYLAYPKLLMENKKTSNFMENEKYFFQKIERLEWVEPEEEVYDIMVESADHSFCLLANIAQNCTESAFWEKAEDKMTAIENTVPVKGGLIVQETTPNGASGYFYRHWMAKNDYVKKKYGWWWLYTQEEVDIIRSRMNNPRKFAQEYELEFLASGRLVFDQDVIIRQKKNILRTGEIVKLSNGQDWMVKEEDGLRVYAPPVDGTMYVCGADSSEGVEGGDYSVFTVFNRTTGEEVAYFKGLIAPDKFAEKCNLWGRKYNNALMVVEINNHGLTVVTELKKRIYPSMYFRPSKFETIATPWSDRLGWRTTKVTRPLLIDDFGQALRDDIITLHSEETLDEMLGFIFDKNNNMNAGDGGHDDSIFSAGIAFQGFKVMYSNPLTQVDYSKHLPSVGY